MEAETRSFGCRLGSMGRVASSGNNAAMESFFVLQKNVLDTRPWPAARSYASRSWSGSRPSTTAVVPNAPSAGCQRSS